MPSNEDHDRRIIGQRLKDTREYLGLSQDEVAKAVDLPRPAISLIESGERKVDALELKRFADVYQQTVDFFLTGQTGKKAAAKDVDQLARMPREVAHLARAVKKLTKEDREELLRFAQFLQSKSKAP